MTKKQPGERKQDQHTSHRMVRLPLDWHEALKALARRERRSITGEVMLALEAHFHKRGVQPPEVP